jgi:hypothetical protein
MTQENKNWLDEYAVTCRAFKGRWNIRHCLRIYGEIRDLKIRMASRSRGKVTRYESSYNPCEHCPTLAAYFREQGEMQPEYDQATDQSYGEAWAV